MAGWTAAARQAANYARHSNPKSVATSAQSSILTHRRGFAASGGDNHGPAKVNFWEDPMHPSKWKEEHFVIVSLAGSGLLVYGGYKLFTRDTKDKNDRDEKVTGASH